MAVGVAVIVSEVVLVAKCNGVSVSGGVEDVAIEASCNVDASVQPKRVSIAGKTKDNMCFIAARLFAGC